MSARRAIVTGCSSGIGLAIVRALLDAGWHVTGLSRHAPDLSDKGFVHIAVDLTQQGAVAQAIDGLAAPDALIHAAGILRVGGLLEMQREDGASMWRLHLDCAVQLVQHFAPDMPDGARIVLIGSRVSDGARNKALYAASKAGLRGLARSLAIELAPRRITINIVAPAATDTPMLRDPARQSTLPDMPPMGRLIQPSEVASCVGFLLSAGAASITGQRLTICAGASL